MKSDKNILSFDIEISDIFNLKNGEDLNKYAPFHISVASTVLHEGEELLWYSVDDQNKPHLNITRQKANDLLCYLKEQQDKGIMICAWNGLNFDLQWIGYNAQNIKLASEIALKLYDPMFQFFNQKGFPVSLASVAEGMDIKQTKQMKGEDAPKQWHAGNYQKVMDYVLGDSQITNQVIIEIMKCKEIAWITQKRETRSVYISKLKTVEDVLKEPEPDQSWMDNPIDRRKFYEWLR
ncbi:MAG: ribonuclease H-like domain-containing protein [Sedimentisphaerales bacterium]|nr:ribonuclease H-like domain-containing protein [Sedimentisphaerales bacterium]